MAFLDNSGDIILDAVLTDTGRKRLAKGNGTFKIVKYAFGDDEINYELYRNSNSPQGAHPSGSQYYDVQILQTPILEAFANNASSMKSKLLSVARNDYLYLPIIKPFYGSGFARQSESSAYIIAVDLETITTIGNVKADGASAGLPDGVLNGYNPVVGNASVRVDQGIDNAAAAPIIPLDPSLKETSYLVQMDNRLGTIYAQNGSNAASVSFIDDDNIATYYLSQGTDSSFVMNIGADQTDTNSSLAGSRGTKLKFKIGASISTRSDNYYFTTLGSTATSPPIGSMSSYSYIDSMVSITGINTGYRVDLPIRYVKKT
tara:strand:+ start:1092 stop:2042 length:951 start_codon:yes stop_codon:yes gene_type:complete